jgi:hypothetical protein
MGCKYSEWGTGKCELFDGIIDMPVDENGICKVEDDDEPGKYCEDYDGD